MCVIQACRIHLQLVHDKSAEDDNVNRNFLRYLVTGTNGCIANVISKPFPYLCLAFPYKSIVSHTCGAIRSWDEWQLSLCFILQLWQFFSPFTILFPGAFSARIFSRSCRWWTWVGALCISSKNKAVKGSSEFPDWQATAEPSVGLLIFPCECRNYLAGPTALSLRIRSQVWELDSARTCFIMYKPHRGRILGEIWFVYVTKLGWICLQFNSI